MPRLKGSTKQATNGGIKLGAKATQVQETELEKLKRENAELQARLESRSTSGRVYAPAETPLEVAKQFTNEMLRDLGHLLVKTIPGSPITRANPYGSPVLVWNKAHTTQMVAMKDGVDRGDFIKIRDMVNQQAGNFWSYSPPEPLTDDQINKILRPVLDNTKQFWSEE